MQWKTYKNTNYEVNKNGCVRNKKTHQKLIPVKNKLGYLDIRLNINKKQVCKRSNRVAFEAWYGNIDKEKHIHHINGIKTDNRIKNLQQLSRKDHQSKTDHQVNKGEQVNTSKLNKQKVMEIRKAKSLGKRSAVLAQKYGVTKATINKIASGKTWKHLPVLNVDNSLWGNPKITGAMSADILKRKYGKDYFSKIAKGVSFSK